MVEQEVILLIPALNPERRLIELIQQILPQWRDPIVIVDDGSSQECRERIFAQIKKMGCEVYTHSENRGKGRALKTGFEQCIEKHAGLIGVVTADADGQHLPEDILACRDALKKHPQSLILGCRDFAEDIVPWKSRYGNRITRTCMRWLCGVSVTDTQTGLRGIPAHFMRELLSIPGERFEFETNMLLETKKQNISIVEVPIATVYMEQNRTSHFHPFRDSIQIYGLILKFAAASLTGFMVDIITYAIAISILHTVGIGTIAITIATIVARVCSAIVNYLMNHKMVFKSEKKMAGSALRYALLCILQMLTSAALVTLLSLLFPISSVILKIIVDFLLFFLSFQIQRRWVF